MDDLQESYALDDTEAPIPLDCDICGTKDFYLESGFYYCSLCNTQSQQTRQYVDEHDFIPERQTTQKAGVLKGGRKLNVKYKDQRMFLSSWEVHNLVIKAMTDKLISMGFPKVLKAKVFQIWSFYLTKRRAIFTSETCDSFAATLKEPKANLYALHDYPRKPIVRQKRDKVVQAEAVEDEFTSISQSKKKKSMAKRKAMEAEYRAEAAKRSKYDDAYDFVNEATSQAGQTVEKPEEPKINLTKQSIRIRNALKHNRKPLELDVKYENKCKPPGFGRAEDLLKVERFTLKSALILLFVALRQIGCRVVFSDIMRMLRDGTLYVQSLKLLLQEQEEELSLALSGSAQFLTSIYRFDNAASCSDDIENFIQYVGLKQFRYPTFEELLPKYMDELCLPKEFECLIVQINKLFSMEEHMEDLRRTTPKWQAMSEIWVLSIIGVTMKLMFGLDDATERYQSHFARTVNNLNAAKEPPRFLKRPNPLFVLEDWFKYMESRNTIVKNELFNVQMYDPDQNLNLTAMNSLVERFSGNKVVREGIVSRSRDNALGLLRDIIKGKEGLDEIATVPEYVSIPLPKESVMEEYKRQVPNVCYPEFNEAAAHESIIDHRIDYLTYPERYFDFLKKEGYKVEVFAGDAKMHKNKIPNDTKTLVMFKPYKRYDDFIGKASECSNSLMFVVNLFSDIVIGADRQGGNKPLFHMLMSVIGDLICKRCLAGFVPVANYEHLLDSIRGHTLKDPQKKYAWVQHIKLKKPPEPTATVTQADVEVSSAENMSNLENEVDLD